MTEFIITILVETGILRADFKHHKKIKRQEQKDGRKRGFSSWHLRNISFSNDFEVKVKAV